MKRINCIALCATSVAPVLWGCTLGPDFTQPRPETPASFVTGTAMASPAQTIKIDAAPADEGAWWARFGDPELSALIALAGGDNFDLRQAALRIAEAREQVSIAAAANYPTFGGDTSYMRQRFSETTAQGRLFGQVGKLGAAIPGASAVALPTFPNPYDQFQIGFDASWEPDLFGRVRRSIEAADADMQASVEDSHSVLVSLESEIAHDYIDLRTAQLKLTIARENLTVARDILLLAQQRRQAGLTNEIDVHSAAAQATATEALIPQLERQIETDMNQLSFLLGREPGALRSELASGKPIPPVPPEIAVGLPADLLRRRPDIRAAEARLHSATAHIGVATADLFPRLTLKADFGTQSLNFPGLADWASRFFNAGPTLQLPIFEGGRLKATVRLNDVREQELAVTYAKTVVSAVHEVENAVVALQNEEQRHASLESTVGENRIALDIARERYAGGVTTFLDVLDAERTLQQNESTLADSTSVLSTDAVALYKALGGGWQQPPELSVVTR
jgi:outer membrane protein, multidrug efflux system